MKVQCLFRGFIMRIKWNRDYIPHKPYPTQVAFLLLPHKEAFFGGAAGGGKSDVLLMGALQYVDVPGFSALIIRRTLTELKQANALLDRAKNWLSRTPAKYLAEEHTYEFPTKNPDGSPGHPARLQFGYLGEYRAEERYQGAEYQYVGVDEMSHFENDSAYTYLFSRLRKNVCPIHQLKEDEEGDMVPNYVPGCRLCALYKSIPVRMRGAGNPGGPGHQWIKNRFQIEKRIDTRINPKTGDEERFVRWVGGNPARPFVPSTLKDNPFIDQKGYRGSLQELDEVRKQQLENGDWDISPDSRFNSMWAKFYTSRGEYFQLGRRHFHYKSLKKVFATVDPAATVNDGPISEDLAKGSKKRPSYSVISVWGLTDDYNLLWIHMKRFQEEIPYLIDEIVDSYRRFQCQYVKMETNGVGIGPSQIVSLRGVNLVANPKARDKFENATNALIRMRAGKVWFPEDAPWLKEAMDEIFTWTGHPGMPDDIVDTLSDACNDVTWDSYGQEEVFRDEGTPMPDSAPLIVPMSPIPGFFPHF